MYPSCSATSGPADLCIVSSFGMAFSQARAFHDKDYGTVFQKFIIALPSLTLATNVVATSLVLSRVLYGVYFVLAQCAPGGWLTCLSALQVSMKRAQRPDHLNFTIGHGGARYRRLMKIIIESGGMYCLTWLILLCLVLSGSTAMHVLLSIIGQLTVRYVSNAPDRPRSLISDFFLS